ncbi:hypothetical protein J1614_002874 [Plenodomus biglobosus]|nr:hypothetical protein J1614_002874 [Plenodomus biglobosus]
MKLTTLSISFLSGSALALVIPTPNVAGTVGVGTLANAGANLGPRQTPCTSVIVEAGTTLSSLTATLGVTSAQIQAANPGVTLNPLTVGSTIQIC